MNKVDVYNSDYTKLNHAYILVYNAYTKLIQCPDYDEEVLAAMESFLRTFNPLLDKIKSEMTVQTRYKDGMDSQNQGGAEETMHGEQKPDSGGGKQNVFQISSASGYSSASDESEESSESIGKGKILRGFFSRHRNDHE